MPGSLRKLRLGVRKAAAVQRRPQPGAGVEVAGARVIAEAGPGLHDRLDRRARQSLSTVGKRSRKRREIGPHRRDRGLLQHDLGQPDPVGIRPPRRAAPARAGRGGGGRTRRGGRGLAALTAVGGSSYHGAVHSSAPSSINAASAPHFSDARCHGPTEASRRSHRCLPRAGACGAGLRGVRRHRRLARHRRRAAGRRSRSPCASTGRAGAAARDPDARPEPATLVVRVESAFALEMQHLAPIVIERVNAHYGWRCVGRLVLKQGPVRRRPTRPAPRAGPDGSGAPARRGRGRRGRRGRSAGGARASRQAVVGARR